MKKLRQNDLYKHIDAFLKDRGIEIRDSAPLGSRLKQGCSLLTDTINHAQSSLESAKSHMDNRIDRMRSAIHEKTAPRESASGTASKSKAKSAKKKAATKKKAAKAAKKTTRPTAKKATQKKVKTATRKQPATKKAAKKTSARAKTARKRTGNR